MILFKIGQYVIIRQSTYTWWGDFGKSKDFSAELSNRDLEVSVGDLFEVITVRTDSEGYPAYCLYNAKKDFTIKANAEAVHECFELRVVNTPIIWNSLNGM